MNTPSEALGGSASMTTGHTSFPSVNSAWIYWRSQGASSKPRPLHSPRGVPPPLTFVVGNTVYPGHLFTLTAPWKMHPTHDTLKEVYKPHKSPLTCQIDSNMPHLPSRSREPVRSQFSHAENLLFLPGNSGDLQGPGAKLHAWDGWRIYLGPPKHIHTIQLLTKSVYTHTHTHIHTNAQGTSSVRTSDARARSHAVSCHLGELPSLAPDSSAESRHRSYNQRTNALQTLSSKHQSQDSRATAEQVCGALCVGAAVGVGRKTAISTGCGQRGASSRRGSSF